MLDNSFISSIKYDGQKLYEDTKGYIHYYKQYLPAIKYINKFYSITFKNEIEKQKEIFVNNYLDYESLKHVIKTPESAISINIIKKLENNNRFISESFMPNLLLQHLISFGYSHMSLNVDTNYLNILKGKPILFFKDNKHYLLLPEDFGNETFFASNSENIDRDKKHISKYL